MTSDAEAWTVGAVDPDDQRPHQTYSLLPEATEIGDPDTAFHVPTLPFVVIEIVLASGQIAARMTMSFADIPAGSAGEASCAAAAAAPAALKAGIPKKVRLR